MHVIFAAITVIIMALFMTFMDRYYNGAFVDIVADIIGWDFAHFLLKNKSMVICFVLLVVLLINSLLVEMYAIRKISHVFSQMKILFQKDDQRIHLDEYLIELENDLNDLKFQSIENEHKAIKEAQHKVDMIAYLAHDIKTPLASVIGYLCLLDETNGLSVEKRKEYTHMTLEKAYRLESLINEFFDIAKIHQASSPLHQEEVNLCMLLQQMKEEFFPILIQKNQEILIKVDETMMMYADPNKIARVFNNILKNAFYYGDEDSAIHIEAFEDEKYTHILFINHGQTIPKDKIDLVFEQFYRLDASRSSATGGSGLGLSIAKTIVEQHGGSIKLTSENHMTTFEVVIPHCIVQIDENV